MVYIWKTAKGVSKFSERLASLARMRFRLTLFISIRATASDKWQRVHIATVSRHPFVGKEWTGYNTLFLKNRHGFATVCASLPDSMSKAQLIIIKNPDETKLVDTHHCIFVLPG